ncbi:MAG: hypothetical protein HGA53_10740, partial [Anaerolineaceae bacterium]|nr:hypothetical protein [Anaerolineaceae bacterium]
QVFLTRNEADALHYLDSHSQAGEMALASDEFNAFIPAFTHLRAVSGHKFETVDYEQTELLVNSFFSGGMNDDEMEGQLNTWRVSYIISGVTGETAAYTLPSGINFELFHTVGNVKIYRRIK